jgi:PKD repeat protein
VAGLDRRAVGYLPTAALTLVPFRGATLACAAACGLATATPVIPDARMIAARTNGVAPLSVFFDAAETTSAVTAIPFHELDYRWDFGDPGSGAWPTDGRSRNCASGPVAAHVFEAPGTYTVTLIVGDLLGEQATQTLVITAEDADAVFAGTNTVCVSQQADFVGAPAGARQIVTNQFAALAAFFAPRMRLLLRRGETWTNAATVRLNAAGPGILGAFGPGAAPVLAVTNASSMLTLSSSSPRLDDWRIMDIAFDGNLVGAWGLIANGVVTRLLLLRLSLRDFHGGLVMPTSILNYYGTTAMYDQITLADATFTHCVGGGGGNILYIEAQRLSLQGCVLWDSRNVEHILRTPWLSKAVISHNDMRDQALYKHVVKMHAPGFNAPGLGSNKFTEVVLLSDNIFVGNADWTVAIGPQDSSDERVRDVLVERNYFAGNTNVQVSLLLWACAVTARNNIFNTANGKFHTCISVSRRGNEPAPVDVRLLNNTGYSPDTRDFTFVTIAAVATNTTVRNTLASAPQVKSPVLCAGTGVGLIADHNMLTNMPGFIVADPGVAADFQLMYISPAVNAGAAVAVFDDFAGYPRPVAGAWDVGAYEFVPETALPAALGALAALRRRRCN